VILEAWRVRGVRRDVGVVAGHALLLAGMLRSSKVRKNVEVVQSPEEDVARVSAAPACYPTPHSCQYTQVTVVLTSFLKQTSNVA
jgi:hypothetical protein